MNTFKRLGFKIANYYNQKIAVSSVIQHQSSFIMNRFLSTLGESSVCKENYYKNISLNFATTEPEI